jgi:carbon storage regulator
MLVLSRKEGEGIRLGDGIELEVISISKGVVRLGIKAPKEVLILRSELAKAVEQTNKAASFKADAVALPNLTSRLKFKS